ncbi:MAG: hypothetical protein RL398_2010 [Planctomycetota bacterium]
MSAAAKPPTTVRRTALALVVAVATATWLLPWNLEAIASLDGFAAAWRRFAEYLADFTAPDLSEPMLARCAVLAAETLAVAVLGTALGLLLAYPLALAAARSVLVADDRPTGFAGTLRRLSTEAARLLLDVLRGVPDFLWAILLATLTGINAGTGVLALALSIAGILGKVLSEQWDNVDPARYEAVRATGAGKLTAFLYGVQPLAARAMQSFVLMRLECAVRNASVIGVVGGGGLGAALWDEYTDGSWSRVATVLLALLLLTVSADVAANWVRRQLRVDPNHPRAKAATDRRSTARRRWTVGIGVAVVLAAAVAMLAQPLGRAVDELRRIDGEFVRNFVTGLLVPDLAPDTLLAVLRHAATPLAIGLLATLGGAVLAGLLAYPGSIAFQLEAHRFTGERLGGFERVRRTVWVIAARGTAVLLRGVPEVAWVVLLMVFWKQGVTPCVLAVTLHSAGVLHRVYAETLDNVPFDRLEKIGNACRSRVFLYGALPRALPDWRTYTFFQFEVNVRIGIALGIVGAGGLGERFKANLDFRELATASSFLWAMVLLTVAIDRTSRALQLRRNRC